MPASRYCSHRQVLNSQQHYCHGNPNADETPEFDAGSTATGAGFTSPPFPINPKLDDGASAAPAELCEMLRS